MQKIIFLTFLLVSGCAQVTSLGLKKHEFGSVPSKIIWFQVAGLSEEHLALLKYGPDAKGLSFERAMCVGKVWNYNLYHLRNTSQLTFMSQMSGTKNVTENCSEFKAKPIWNYLKDNGYASAILESEADDDQRLNWYFQCDKAPSADLQNLSYWVRSKKGDANQSYFPGENYQRGKRGIFTNRSCLQGECLSTLNEDFLHVERQLAAESKKYLLIVRDFTFLNSLKVNNFKQAKSKLLELAQLYQFALKLSEESGDHLILLTSSESKVIQLPKEGKDWFNFERGKITPQQSPSLINLSLASGARSENFCGFYDDSQILDRILSGPKQQGLELKFINPFN